MCEQLDATQRICAPAARALLLACSAGEAQYVEVLVDCRVGIASPTPASTANNNGVVPTSGSEPFVNNPQQAPGPLGVAPRHSSSTISGAAGAGGAALFGGAVAVAAPIGQRPVAQRPAPQRPRMARSRTNGTPGANAPAAPAFALVGPAPGANASSAAADAECLESTPLLAAVSKGFFDVVSLLLERHDQPSADINATLPSGKSSLYLAAERGDARTCAKLLDAGATLAATTCSGRSALFAAVEHGHVDVVRALCERAEVWHLTQQTPSGVSPLTLAERRGKPSLILPLLRCYHRHVRRRYHLRQPGEAVADITDPYLTVLCLKFKDQLFRQAGDAGENGADASVLRGRPGQAGEPVSQTLRLARSRGGDEPAAASSAASGTGRAAVRSLSATGSRYSRVMEQSRPNVRGAEVEGRCRLRVQLDLPETADGSRVGSLPQSARPRGPQQPRRASDASTPSASAGAAPARRPWGSAAPPRRQRPLSATPLRPAPSRQGGAGGGIARSSSGELWQRARGTVAAPSAASSSPRDRGLAAPSGAANEAVVPGACLSAGYVVGPIGAALRPQAFANGATPEVAWLPGGSDREEAAMEADDAMAALLAGYFCDEEDADAADEDDPDVPQDDINGFAALAPEEIPRSPPADRSSLSAARAAAACDLAMYSDDSEDEDVGGSIDGSCGGG